MVPLRTEELPVGESRPSPNFKQDVSFMAAHNTWMRIFVVAASL
jgi:hypothetical protein